MSTTSYSSNGSRPTSRQYNTGFPDSFASCTTSMRHPDAIIDPTFAISAEHIDPAKTLHRSRKSMLRKHRRTISHGKITEASFGQDYMERPASAANNATEIEQKVQGVNAHSSAAGAETPSRSTGSKDILGFTPGFHYVESREHRGNIFNKMMNKT
ncbi:hypothetical protein F4680DRAFT_449463 [Xylaria scruposa]|nr:hypothetical protein F4680DRAFT_449463 [Xylaria scruposa]